MVRATRVALYPCWYKRKEQGRNNRVSDTCEELAGVHGDHCRPLGAQQLKLGGVLPDSVPAECGGFWADSERSWASVGHINV